MWVKYDSIIAYACASFWLLTANILANAHTQLHIRTAICICVHTTANNTHVVYFIFILNILFIPRFYLNYWRIFKSIFKPHGMERNNMENWNIQCHVLIVCYTLKHCIKTDKIKSSYYLAEFSRFFDTKKKTIIAIECLPKNDSFRFESKIDVQKSSKLFIYLFFFNDFFLLTEYVIDLILLNNFDFTCYRRTIQIWSIYNA